VREALPEAMRALVYRGINDLRVETIPVPRIGPRELLVKVAVCGVCPTDIKKIQYGIVPPPRIFGHETAGTIVKVGARIHGFRLGDRVALHHHVPCLRCDACRHAAFAQCAGYKRTGITAGFEPAGGGFAEYVRVMSSVLSGVVKIPARNSFVEGAMLEPVNTVVKAVNRLDPLKGDCVLVVGQGPVGLMFTCLLAERGIDVIACDLLEARLRLARGLGARWVIHGDLAEASGRIAKWTRGKGLDAAVIAVPSDAAVLLAQSLLRGGGKVLLFAHTRRGTQSTIDLASVCVDEKDLMGSYSSDARLQRKVVCLVFSRQMDVRKLVTHILPIEHGIDAIQLASKPQPGTLKIMISANDESCS